VLPVVSLDALDRVLRHDATKVDYMLLEWVMALECFHSEQSRVVPVATLSRAAELLAIHQIQPRAGLQARSLDALLSEVFGFSYFPAWKVCAQDVEEEVARKTIDLLDGLSGDNKRKVFTGTLQSLNVSDNGGGDGDINVEDVSANTASSLGNAWTVSQSVLHTPEYLRHEKGLMDFLADLGVTTADELSFLDTEDIIKMKTYLRKVGERKISSFLSL
jgi:hypothetical protein